MGDVLKTKSGLGYKMPSPPLLESSFRRRTARLTQLTPRCVGLIREAKDRRQEIWIFLPDEQAVIDKALDCCPSARVAWRCRANDGHRSKTLVQEVARLRHDQVRLQVFRLVLRQVDERHCRFVDWIKGRQWRGISRFVLPRLEVHRFRPTNAQENAQNFQAGHLLRQCGVQAGSSLFDEGKVKARGERDGLQPVVDRFCVVVAQEAGSEVCVRARDSRELSAYQAWYCILEFCSKVWIRRTPIACPPGGVHAQLRQVG